MYVNGQYRGDDAIGALMHDFNCADARKMKNKQMRDSVMYLKETREGRELMCKYEEAFIAKGRAEGLAEGKTEGERKKAMEMALGLYAMQVPIATIAKAAKVSAEQVQQWINENKNEVLV